jgi:hypothetical protein
VGAQGPQFDADKAVRLHVVSDPAADNRLRLGPVCRALDVSPSPPACGRACAVLPSPSGFLKQMNFFQVELPHTPERSLNDAGERGADGSVHLGNIGKELNHISETTSPALSVTGTLDFVFAPNFCKS